MEITMEEISRRLRIAVAISGADEHDVAFNAGMEPEDFSELLNGTRKKVSSLELALICEAANVPFEAIIPADLLRMVLEALCKKQGISLESEWEGPARNFELIERLGIGHVLKLP
jgi:hypothetical protein